MSTTQELAVSDQNEAPEPQTTAEVFSAVAQSTPDDAVTRRARIVKRQPLTFARRMLHAIAEAGQPPATHQLQPLVGPNGALIWTHTSEDKLRSPGNP
jgi:hypothetical protein